VAVRSWIEEAQNAQIHQFGAETPLLVVVWPKGVLVVAHGDIASCTWWRVQWLGAIRLPHIGRSAPCILDYDIIFPDGATMKA
jgi:hypothetical protein